MCATSWLCVLAMFCFEWISADAGSRRKAVVLPVINP